MNDKKKYEGLIDEEGYIYYDGLDHDYDEVKDILFNLGVEGNEYGDLAEYISKLLVEVKRLAALFEETNYHLDLMVERFGIEALVEMVGDEEES